MSQQTDAPKKKERFGVAVEAGTVEKLRELAGGERKIGEYLTAVVDLFWKQRQDNSGQATTPALTFDPPVAVVPIQRADLEAEIAALDEIIVDMAQRMARQDRELSYFRSVIESATRIDMSLDEYLALRKSQRQDAPVSSSSTESEQT